MVTGQQPMEKLKDKPTTENNKLSILIAQDGFSFCVVTKKKQISLFHHEKINASSNYTKDLLVKFQDVIHANFIKEHCISKVQLVYENDSFSLVPTPFFEEEKISHYIKYNTAILANDFFAHDTIENLQITNVFIPYVHINNYVHELFGVFEYQHHLSLLLASFYNNTNETEIAYAVVTKTYVNLICFRRNKVLLCNAYAYKTIEDIAYHLLFALEQLNLNREELTLYLSNNNEDRQLTEYISSYIKTIKPFKLTDFSDITEFKNANLEKQGLNELLLLNL